MTAQNIKAIITAYFKAFNASDNEAMLRLLHEDVAHDINQGDRQIGKEALRWFNAARSKHFDEHISDIVIMMDENGSRAAAEFTIHGKYIAKSDGLPAANGQQYSLTAAMVFEVEDGEITRISSHYNQRDWLAQLG
ncbi:MAG: ketosteroid isomerase-related protein [Ahrensia sp.]|nr:ketosteroid isomerase-related protein [Ahrensia sp.]